MVRKIYIAPKKNGGTILEVTSGHDIDETYQIGNSIRSDINPSIEARIKAIYIAHEAWTYEKAHNSITNPDMVLKLQKFEYIKDVYKYLE